MIRHPQGGTRTWTAATCTWPLRLAALLVPETGGLHSRPRWDPFSGPASGPNFPRPRLAQCSTGESPDHRQPFGPPSVLLVLHARHRPSQSLTAAGTGEESTRAGCRAIGTGRRRRRQTGVDGRGARQTHRIHMVCSITNPCFHQGKKQAHHQIWDQDSFQNNVTRRAACRPCIPNPGSQPAQARDGNNRQSVPSLPLLLFPLPPTVPPRNATQPHAQTRAAAAPTDSRDLNRTRPVRLLGGRNHSPPLSFFF